MVWRWQDKVPSAQLKKPIGNRNRRNARSLFSTLRDGHQVGGETSSRRRSRLGWAFVAPLLTFNLLAHLPATSSKLAINVWL
jgi:hypothetical protein